MTSALDKIQESTNAVLTFENDLMTFLELQPSPTFRLTPTPPRPNPTPPYPPPGKNLEAMEDTKARRRFTKLGTTDYMAPEMLRGKG